MEKMQIIQGGMGAGVSNWRLARAVSQQGQLGVVSGTAMDLILARRLQDGDPGGHMRRALEHFPYQDVAKKILDRYFVEGGKGEDEPYRPIPMHNIKPSRFLQEIAVAANFVEVWLAKEGHDGPVGINLLEKIQLPNVMSLYGAMLAEVDYVLMGAGIPREIPGVLDLLSEHKPASLRINVEGAQRGEEFRLEFDPTSIFDVPAEPLKRPDFLAIIASNTLAVTLSRKATGKVNGFVVEGPTAGGHNAPPRGSLALDEDGEPIYGSRDVVDLEAIKALGLPFWIAGSHGSAQSLKAALEAGAEGIQVGTLFAFCEESGLVPAYKKSIIAKAMRGEATVKTDPLASPTGFPFKVVSLEESVSEQEVYEERPRICDLGYLRHVYRREDGSAGYRCPSEPIDDFIKKGGESCETDGRKCLCNGLVTNIGHAQPQPKTGYRERPLLTAGDDINKISRLCEDGNYTAADVIEYLLGRHEKVSTAQTSSDSETL